ncbi:uncharacterized protein AB675_5631 [Cyphellophora attinorum]|uniref:BRCT domain-containing protein n=1 Tax=Cyphellophora attinorum TaxID=1664694 RepID=A0A0N1HC03_9EURO|nr:uncharacterized protein AB675_5631 [Phialophora attinorum]KPI42063.1 hypothetical protein AB675_5631 [Phialophora attinorum]
MADFGETEDKPQRNRGIMLSKFTEKCDGDDFQKHFVPIFHRNPATGALDLIVQKFPREALVLFSDLFRADIIRGEKLIELPKHCDEKAIKEILEWIRRCIENKEIVEFDTYDEDDPETLARYIKIIRAAESIEVPARDFQEKIIKRMRKMAKFQREKDRRLSWDLIEDIYRDETAPADLRQVAAATIFFSWWSGHLDSEDTPEEMEVLSELREDYPDFDKDLKAEFEDQKRFIDERKAKRDAEREGADGTGAGWDNAGDDAAAGGGGDWDAGAGAIGGGWDADAGGATTGGTDDWAKAAPVSGDGGWMSTDSTAYDSASGQENIALKKEDVGAVSGHAFESSTDSWADEVNTTSATPAW